MMTDSTNHAEALKHFHSRMEDVREALKDAEKQIALNEGFLCIDARISVHVQISTGGPGDGFEIICDATTGEPLHGRHYFVDWGFRREIPLSSDELADVCAAYGLDDGRDFLPERRSR